MEKTEIAAMLKDSRYQHELQRIDRSKVFLTSHAIGRYYEHIHMNGARQNWEEMPADKLSRIKKSPEWQRAELKVRELLERADWRASGLSKAEKLQKEKLHPGDTFYFKCYRCTFVVARNKCAPGTYILITMWFLRFNE